MPAIEQMYWGQPFDPHTDTDQLNRVLDNLYRAVRGAPPATLLINPVGLNSATVTLDPTQNNVRLGWQGFSSAAVGLRCRVNGDATAAYFYNYLEFQNLGVSAGYTEGSNGVPTTFATIGAVPNNAPGSGVLTIPSFRQNGAMVCHSDFSKVTPGGATFIRGIAGFYHGGPITTVQLFLDAAATWATPSQITVSYF